MPPSTGRTGDMGGERDAAAERQMTEMPAPRPDIRSPAGLFFCQGCFVARRVDDLCAPFHQFCIQPLAAFVF